jgi:glycosyltransferase involved in cell wall biosynthesis
MRLAHSVIVTPGRCGLYETTRELVTGLRKLGVDSRMYDPGDMKLHPGGEEDRGAKFCDLEWAKSADILVNHSGLKGELDKTDTPVIHVAHGRPRASFLSELKGGPPVYSYHYQKDKDPRFKTVVTFWPEHKPYHEVMWPNTPVQCVTAPVDLKAWSPDGPSGYDCHGKCGDSNIICTDVWRDDADPFEVINAFALFAKEHIGAKLHMYGTSLKMGGISALLKSIQDQGNLGEVLPWVTGLANVYRAADLLITPHTIAVRSIREAMACGCPVAKMETMDIEKFAEQMDMHRAWDRGSVRAHAEGQFDSAETAKEFLAIASKIELRKAA